MVLTWNNNNIINDNKDDDDNENNHENYMNDHIAYTWQYHKPLTVQLITKSRLKEDDG